MRGWLVLVVCAGCGFQAVGDDGGSSDDLGVDDLAGADLTGADLTGADLSTGASCRQVVLPCLDPAPANVIEVPGESTAQSAFMTAKSGDTIQIKGLQLGAGFRVPAGVTLRGCSGAQIVSTLAFAGSTGIIEGFIVPGTIVANVSGVFVIRYNRFTGGGSTGEPGVSARAVDGIVGANVDALVDSNLFELRAGGVEARTTYDTMMRRVKLTLRNNVFTRVDAPVYASEGGLVGEIELFIEHNTLADFKTGVRMLSLTSAATLRWNVLAHGTQGIDGDSAYSLTDTWLHALTIDHAPAPISGMAQHGDPMFVDKSNGDLRLGAGSPLLDAIASATLATDYFGCGRGAKPDPGAIETKP